ncbi:hypothetical protein N6H18_07255 [Reichenbachiella agarivorans]|uniref:Tellurite resistance protein TerB n=1 Tax=Reichenbachiella agarivorans TaxID=2979464 RepID=A0ABY6CV19_9BACT|nr:hypothetical protein [Reichenbachiella agarivorans]UXP33749.1 hypothetical protein N6H18_07255 [Reichenbachiella agarivorans]
MNQEEKKAFMLLKSLIFHYHGLDEDEEKILNESADKLSAHEELQWANDFIAEDFMSAFDRSREMLSKIIGVLPVEKKLAYLFSVWEDNNKKGYLTEMEATAMLNLAKDWGIRKELMDKVREA